MTLNHSQQDSRALAKRAASIGAQDKPSHRVAFCRAFFTERDRGEVELYDAASGIVTMAGRIALEKPSLLAKLPQTQQLISEIYGTAGKLETAGQGGSDPATDEAEWRELQRLVFELGESDVS